MAQGSFALPLASASDRSNRLAKLALLSMLTAAVAFSLCGTVGKPDCQDLDFGAYYRAGLAVRHGQSPYRVDQHGPLGVYPYAPAYAFCFAPLSCLGYLWACRLWLLLNWAAAVACFVLAARLVLGDRPCHEQIWVVVALAALATGSYVWANVRVGQVGLMMLLGCLGWAVCRREGRPFLGGVLLALACALKLAPGVLVPYLIVKRDLRGLAGLAVGGAGLFLFPALAVGWHGTLTLHGQWVEHTSATHVPVQTYRPGNQSLLAQLARLPAVSNGHECYSADNVNLLHRAYPLLVLLLGAAVYGWVAWGQTGAAKDAGRSAENLHLALLLVFMTLAHPRAWRCNFVALIVPCVLLASCCCRRGPGWRVAMTALLFLVLVALWPTSGVGEGEWTAGAWLLQGKHFWGAVAVTAACWWCPRKPAARARSAGKVISS